MVKIHTGWESWSLQMCFFFYRLLEMDTNGIKEGVPKEDFNPWAVSSIWDFNYFFCPECDCRSQSKQGFVDHVSAFHTWVS